MLIFSKLITIVLSFLITILVVTLIVSKVVIDQTFGLILEPYNDLIMANIWPILAVIIVLAILAYWLSRKGHLVLLEATDPSEPKFRHLKLVISLAIIILIVLAGLWYLWFTKF